jgi:hypothetical protein
LKTIDVPTFGDIPLIVLSRGYDPDQDWQAMPVELLHFSSDSQQSIGTRAAIPSNSTSPRLA